MTNSAVWQELTLQNPNDLDFDLSRSLKVKYDGATALPIYDFLLVFYEGYEGRVA